ncbi:MAG TPA: polysaccharide pyruvyl transferase family protein [Chloroflexia bacterium]|jgi:succinoglycan biosynthesis protein ExoV
MRLYYYRDPIGNFGDDLNPWLWSRLLPGVLDDVGNTLFVGIGSVLDHRIPAAPVKVVFGTGVGHRRLPAIDERWKIYCVRGPLSAAALRLPQELAITDPAVLVGTQALQEEAKLYAVSFMPHFRTEARLAAEGVDLETICRDVGLNYIDAMSGVEKVLTGIRRSEIVIAEAMHGAIVADALRVPWVPVQLSGQVLSLKWQDWCKSLDLEYGPHIHSPEGQSNHSLGLAEFMRSVRQKGRPTLSASSTLEKVTHRLLEQLERVRAGEDSGGWVAGRAEFIPDPQLYSADPWMHTVYRAIEEMAEVVPMEKSFILVDEAKWGDGEVLGGRHAIRFPERNGQYWGHPQDDETAIVELEQMRQRGVSSIVFAWHTFWWLDHYSGLKEHLQTKYRRTLSNERLVIFDLSS